MRDWPSGWLEEQDWLLMNQDPTEELLYVFMFNVVLDYQSSSIWKTIAILLEINATYTQGQPLASAVHCLLSIFINPFCEI